MLLLARAGFGVNRVMGKCFGGRSGGDAPRHLS